jgi:phosphatidylserine decarboxylase
MFTKKLFITSQYLMPQHLLSRFVGAIADSEIGFIKRTFINTFMKKFNIELNEAVIEDPDEFSNFNNFFTRALKPDARTIDMDENVICSPVDGAVSQLGKIEQGNLFQAKGFHFTAADLLANSEMSERYKNGTFNTIYLSPSDYHRIHMPLDGRLKSMTYIPGKLFSVNTTTAENVPGLFARNERLVCEFENDKGTFVMVLVGAMIVAAIETVWAGRIAPLSRRVLHFPYDEIENVELKKGEEMGRFCLGSTVVLLFPEDNMQFNENLKSLDRVYLGEGIGQYSA